MEDFDKVLLEQYFTYMNMSELDRNLFINILLHTKDVEDSEFSINEKSSNNYDLLTLNLRNSNGIIKFNGAIYNDNENRILDGIIAVKGNKIIVNTSVFRLFDLINDYEKEYDVFDLFVFKNGKVIRRSNYDNGKYFQDEVTLMTNDEVEEYLQNKVDKMKERKI